MQHFSAKGRWPERRISGACGCGIVREFDFWMILARAPPESHGHPSRGETLHQLNGNCYPHRRNVGLRSRYEVMSSLMAVFQRTPNTGPSFGRRLARLTLADQLPSPAAEPSVDIYLRRDVSARRSVPANSLPILNASCSAGGSRITCRREPFDPREPLVDPSAWRGGVLPLNPLGAQHDLLLANAFAQALAFGKTAADVTVAGSAGWLAPVADGHRGNLASRERDFLLAARPNGGCPEKGPALLRFAGRVSNSGEGRWTSGASSTRLK